MVSELAEEVVDYEDAEEDPDMPAAPAPREASRRAHTPSQQAVRPACSAHRHRAPGSFGRLPAFRRTAAGWSSPAGSGLLPPVLVPVMISMLCCPIGAWSDVDAAAALLKWVHCLVVWQYAHTMHRLEAM